MKKNLLYHGSNTEVIYPEIRKSRFTKDFSWGFYCTSNYARATANRRRDVMKYFSKEELSRQLRLAEVNHCLTFEQAAGELIEEFHIPDGDFDTVKGCKYEVPPVTAIGRLYQQLISDIGMEDDREQGIIDVFSSFLSDEISNFNSNVYYSNPDYLKHCYLEGELLY